MKVSIITRAYERLEYTIQCINGVFYNAGYEYYEHIIVDQGSSDGTQQWLKWITKMPNNWYNKIKPVYLRRNVGDFGGMKVGFKHAEGDIIMQLDNDIYMETKDWLAKMVHAMIELDAHVMMAETKGCKGKIDYDEDTRNAIYYKGKELEYAKIQRAVACYLIRRDVFQDKYKKAINCRQVTKGDNSWKILNVYGVQMEGYDPITETYIQHDKFDFQAKKLFLIKKYGFKQGRRKVL